MVCVHLYLRTSAPLSPHHETGTVEYNADDDYDETLRNKGRMDGIRKIEGA